METETPFTTDRTHRVYSNTPQWRAYLPEDMRPGNALDLPSFTFGQMVRAYRQMRRAGMSPTAARDAVWFPVWAAALHTGRPTILSFDETHAERAGVTS